MLFCFGFCSHRVMPNNHFIWKWALRFMRKYLTKTLFQETKPRFKTTAVDTTYRISIFFSTRIVFSHNLFPFNWQPVRESNSHCHGENMASETIRRTGQTHILLCVSVSHHQDNHAALCVKERLHFSAWHAACLGSDLYRICRKA